jgi:cell wall-associated NlpC family hydrolase
MMHKKIISLLIIVITVASVLSIPTFAADELRIQGVTASGGSFSVLIESGSADQIGYMIYDNFSLVCEGYESFSGGTSVSLNVPTEYLRAGMYKVTVWGVSGTTAGKFYSFDVQAGSWSGSLSVIPWTPGGQNERDYMASIKTPQAVLYADPLMVTQKASLKRFDRLFIMETSNPLVYYSFGYFLRGSEIQTVEDSGGYEKISNAEWFDGYIWSNTVRSVAFKEEMPKEIADLAHSRLGLNGIYTQNTGDALTGRWGVYSQDCSSFVYWVYKEFGLKMGAATADTEAAWHRGVASVKPEISVFDGLGAVTPFIESMDPENIQIWFEKVDPDTSISSPVNAVKFTKPTADIIDTLQPGDTLYFNHFTDIKIMISIWHPPVPGTEAVPADPETGFEGSPGSKGTPGYWGEPTATPATAQIVEPGTTYGVDHAAIYIGDGKYIHASGRGRNTIISELAPVLPEVVYIGRPLEIIPE